MMSAWFYVAGAIGMYIGLKECGEKFHFWLWLFAIGAWPVWLVADYVSRSRKAPSGGNGDE